jgi:hypothetical protein
MALTTRVLPVGATGGTITGVCGSPEPNQGLAGKRYYSCNVGSTLDVPGDPTGDAAVLTSQNFAIIAMSGSTASRPPAGILKPRQLFVDTTLSFVLCWDGLTWRNVLTGAAA